jgi:hypothetical protein
MTSPVITRVAIVHEGPERPAWMSDPARHCAGFQISIFFDEEDEAIQICRGCPVTLPCLEWAFEFHEYGVWGATTRNQRAELMRAIKLHDRPRRN